jgi:hypothetical protein
MAGDGSSPKGAVGGFTSGGVGVPPVVGRGLEARGVKWCSWRACEGGREGEKERASDISDAFNQRGG